MNDSERIEVFSALAELARRYPHWRVGQLIANVAGWTGAELWDAEDEQLLCAARAHLGTLAGSEAAQTGSIQAMQNIGAA